MPHDSGAFRTTFSSISLVSTGYSYRFSHFLIFVVTKKTPQTMFATPLQMISVCKYNLVVVNIHWRWIYLFYIPTFVKSSWFPIYTKLNMLLLVTMLSARSACSFYLLTSVAGEPISAHHSFKQI